MDRTEFLAALAPTGTILDIRKGPLGTRHAEVRTPSGVAVTVRWYDARLWPQTAQRFPWHALAWGSCDVYTGVTAQEAIGTAVAMASNTPLKE